MGKEHSYIMVSVVVAILLVLLAVLWWGMSTGTGAALAQSGPVVRLVPQTLGQQEVILTITGTNISDLGGFEFDLTVDPAVARLQDAQVGDFLGSTGRTVGALGPLVGSEGESLAFGAYSYDPSGGQRAGPSGDGHVATVSLLAVREGTTAITLSNPLFVDVNADTVPVTVEGAALQVKALHSGWNLVAPCVDTAGLGVPRTLASLAGVYDMVLGEQGTYVVGLPEEFQSLHEVSPPWSYYIRVQGSGAVTMTQVSAPFDPSSSISLRAGWRWIGYCGGSTLPITVALQSIDGKYDMVLGEQGTYVVGLPEEFQSLREMRPGEGYLIRMIADGVLQYPG